jgi:SAM-dependent methyltransferase
VVLPSSIVSRFRCPTCHEDVHENHDLVCREGHVIPITSGYVDASGESDPSTAQTLESFGRQWIAFDQAKADDQVIWERFFREIPPEDLAEDVAIDVGCGNGRFAQLTARKVKALVALDGSLAVRSAAHNLRSEPNVAVVRSDLRAAPFSNGTFDLVSCLGVLHHLEDPEEGFKAIERLVAPEGRLLIFIYSRPERFGPRTVALASVATARRVTIHIPPRAMRIISWSIAMAAWLFIIGPGRFGERHSLRPLARMPLAAYRNLAFHNAWLNTYDLLMAPIEHRYVWAEVERWFREAGLVVDSVRDENGLIILAHRPPPPD